MEDHVSTTVCYRHPDRPTGLSCSECGRPICAECSIDAPVGQRCPECAKPTGRHRVIDARRIVAGPRFETSPITFTLIAINVALFLVALGSASIDRRLFNDFSAYNYAISQGEWWRILTAAFLHLNTVHILFNMYALYLFGPRLEQQVGSVAFASLYFAAAAGGGAASYLLGPLNQASVGASGAIFGLFGAWMFVAYQLRKTQMGRAMFNQLILLLVLNLALPLVAPSIDWRAHAGGFVIGLLVAALWAEFAKGRPNARAVRTGIGTAMLVFMILIVAL
ncbi:MAG: rhomboid family intramembrane serine protease [Acidimicrobiia bacterium]|jgi:membrane associated rhomboid family serine protease